MNLFGYFDIGRRAMAASQLGLQVAGDNIANANTPGYARRRVELVTGPAVEVPGGWLSQGVDVAGVSRAEDGFLQAALDRERGGLGSADETLRGLQEIESVYGSLDGNNVASSLTSFGSAFTAVAGQPDSAALRRGAVAAAQSLAGSIRSTYARLTDMRSREDGAVSDSVTQINALATELAGLNKTIAQDEVTGHTASPQRDRRDAVLADLADLTGGTVAKGTNGQIRFELQNGTTLVSGDAALTLQTTRAADGTLRVLAGADGSDITDRMRGGRLGAHLKLRDEAITTQLSNLDALASDLTTRANALTASARDLNGNPGGPLFVPNPPGATGAAASIDVASALVQDPSKLAISLTGAAGDGSVASSIAGLKDTASSALGGKSPAAFLADGLAALGGQVAEADVANGVSKDMVNGLQARRDSVSGVSMDEEAVALIQNQKAFEAAARFLTVLQSITDTAINLVAH